MKKYLVSGIKLAFSLGLGVGLIWWIVSHMTPEEQEKTWDAFKRAKYGWILLAPVLGILSNLSRTQRWRQLLEPTGHMPGYWNTFFSVMMMYFFNLFFPRLGEVTRCGVLARYEKVPLDKSIGTMVVERFVDLISILLIGGVLFLFESERLITFWNKKAELANAKGATAADGSSTIYWVIGAILVLVIAAVAFWFLQRKHGLDKLKSMALDRIRGLWEGLMSIRNLKRPWEFLAHTVFIWFCYLMMVYVSFPALEETSGLGILAAMAGLFMCGFAIVLSPGGVGFYPLFMQFVLMMYGVDKNVGYAFGSVVWAAQIGSMFIGGLLSLILLAILNREPALDKETPLNTAP